MGKYSFRWDLIGNVEEGRANMGPSVDLDVYRLMQFTLRDVMEQSLGTEETDRLFFQAGRIAGEQFFAHAIAPVDTLSQFVSKTQRVLREKKIGILRVEQEDMARGKVVLTVDEDLDCSGLPVLDYETCIYDEGFISGLFQAFSKEPWVAKEVDCWCTGARTCRFLVTRENAERPR